MKFENEDKKLYITILFYPSKGTEEPDYCIEIDSLISNYSFFNCTPIEEGADEVNTIKGMIWDELS